MGGVYMRRGCLLGGTEALHWHTFSDLDICFRILIYDVPHDLGKITEPLQVQIRCAVQPTPVYPSKYYGCAASASYAVYLIKWAIRKRSIIASIITLTYSLRVISSRTSEFYSNPSMRSRTWGLGRGTSRSRQRRGREGIGRGSRGRPPGKRRR